MSRLIIIHGSFGHPEENWIPYLRSRFAAGHDVVVPHFGSGDEQNLDLWSSRFTSVVGELQETDVIVGHSIGCAFIANVLSQPLSSPITASMYVSPFTAMLGVEEFDNVNDTFVNGAINWKLVQSNAQVRLSWHGDNDPYVPLPYAEEFAKNAGAELTVVAEGGHLNESAGFTEFVELGDAIESVIDN